MSSNEDEAAHHLTDLFPTRSKVLLTGGGKQFIERIGVDAARQVVLGVMMGENIRKETEPLTQRRIAQISGAMIALFARGYLEIPDFADKVSSLAVHQLTAGKNRNKSDLWIAQWILGLTSKSVQNVLRSNQQGLAAYVNDFEAAVAYAASRCQADIGKIQMTLGFAANGQARQVELGWEDIIRLTIAVGSQTLTIRGSEKSLYGKLFEKLILGSFLTMLGFRRVTSSANTDTSGVFWLSDSSTDRESDATLLLQPGKLARFDIGFIGVGNSEISKDKLSRYEREQEISGNRHNSVTFIVVDRLQATSKTQQAAERIGAEIVQMSMQFWPRELAQRLGKRLGVQHELQTMPDSQIAGYLRTQLATIPIQDFLADVSLDRLENAVEQDEPAGAEP